MRSVFKRRTAEARRLLIRTSASFEVDDSKSASDGAKWFSIIFQGLALLFFIWYYVGLPWLFHRLVGYPLGDSYNREITVGGVGLPLLLGLLFNMSHYHVWGSDPGFKSSSSSTRPTAHKHQLRQKREDNDEEELGKRSSETDVAVDPQAHQHQASDALGNELRWCEPCQHNQPIRSRHCRKCGCCVRKFDHHCFWVNTCVGERNHFRFTVLLLWATLYITIGGVVVLSHIEIGSTTHPPSDTTTNYDAPTSRPLTGGSNACVTNTHSAIDVHCYLQTGTRPVCGGSCVVTWGVWWAFNTIPLLVGAVCVLMCVFTVSLLTLHVYLLLSNQTTWEVSSGPPKNTITYLAKAQTPEPFNDGIIRNTRVALVAAALGGDIPPNWCSAFITNNSTGRSSSTGMFVSSSDDDDDGDYYDDVPRTTDTSMEEGRSTISIAPTTTTTITTTAAAPLIMWPQLSPLGRILGGMGKVVELGCWCCLRGAMMRYTIRRLEKLTRGKTYCELRTSKKRWKEMVEARGLSRGVRHLVECPPRRWKTVINPNVYAAEFDTLEIEWHPFQ